MSRALSRAALLSCALASAACGCGGGGGKAARLSDGWVVASGVQGSTFLDQPAPAAGQPLGQTPGQRCLSNQQLLSAFGAICNHESENPGAGAQPSSGDLGPGIPPTSDEVRWYCGGDLVVRVVLQRCSTQPGGNMDGVTPVEIAVKTKRH